MPVQNKILTCLDLFDMPFLFDWPYMQTESITCRHEIFLFDLPHIADHCRPGAVGDLEYTIVFDFANRLT